MESSAKNTSETGIDTDMELIARELQEEELLPGAYCHSYETFKNIYRFVERRIERTRTKAFIVLITLTDKFNDFPPLEVRESRMELLGDKIQENLRIGDIYAQYSSCQYLVMVSDLTKVDVEIIADRICRSFFQESPGGAEEVVLHHSYPLRSIRKAKETKI